MLDYRNLKTSDLENEIRAYGQKEVLREELLDSLLAVAVWHSVKDGQITPAVNLLGVSRGNKDRVCLYLTKFGNLSYSKEKGLKFSKEKSKAQFGIDKANEVFESLPSLEEAFPSKPKEYKDIPFASQIKAILNKAQTLSEHGKKFVFSNDEEKALFEMLQALHV